MTLAAVARILVVAAMAWGLLAFGAVYPWAAGTLMVLSVAAAASGLAAGRGRASPGWAIGGAMLCCLGAVAVQLVPLPSSTLAAVSPATPVALRALDPMFALTGGPHPLSIHPDATRHALRLAAALFGLMLGVAALTSTTGTRWLMTAVTVLGGSVAVAAIVLRFSGSPKVYGFWQPELVGAMPFGPFVNRNHYAGWMLMALPLVAAHALSTLRRAGSGGPATHSDRMLWMGSSDGTRFLLATLSAFVMATSILLTFSRSGTAALVVAALAFAGFAAFRLKTKGTRLLPFGLIALLLVILLAWAGMNVIERRLAESESGEIQDRRGAWADGANVAARFPRTGTGVATYRYAMLLYQSHNPGQYYAHAHNDYLQLAAEGGMLVGLPAIALLGAILWRIRVRFRDDGSESSWWARAGAITGLLAIGLQETVEFSLQMPGNAALCAVLLGLALHRSPGRPRATSSVPDPPLPRRTGVE